MQQLQKVNISLFMHMTSILMHFKEDETKTTLSSLRAEAELTTKVHFINIVSCIGFVVKNILY